MYFIRHARQTHHNTDADIHPLTQRDVRHLQKLPSPDRLVVSPYLRTRETALQIVKLLDLYLEYELEPRLGEFAQYSIQKSTQEAGGRIWPGANSKSASVRAPVYTEWSSGVKKAYQDLEKEDGVTWVVTHSMVVKWVDEHTTGSTRYRRAREYPHLSVISNEGEFFSPK